jgi:hypothetical protein
MLTHRSDKTPESRIVTAQWNIVEITRSPVKNTGQDSKFCSIAYDFFFAVRSMRAFRSTAKTGPGILMRVVHFTEHETDFLVANQFQALVPMTNLYRTSPSFR